MPYIPNRSQDEKSTQLASALLQVLVQLAKPSHGIVVALPTGHVLAANAQTINYKPNDSDFGTSRNLRSLMGVSQERFQAILDELQQHRKLTGLVEHTSKAHCSAYTYSCRMVHFQEETFICVELASIGQATALLPYDGDSYHEVFEANSEPMFLLDCEGKFIDINKAALKLAKLKKENLTGSSILQSFGLNLLSA